MPSRSAASRTACSRRVHDHRGEAHRQLVGEQHLGVAAEAAGEAEHLLLAARQQPAADVEALLELGEQRQRVVERRRSATRRLSRVERPLKTDFSSVTNISPCWARLYSGAVVTCAVEQHLARRAAAARRTARASSSSCRRRSARAGRRPRPGRTSRSRSWIDRLRAVPGGQPAGLDRRARSRATAGRRATSALTVRSRRHLQLVLGGLGLLERDLGRLPRRSARGRRR